MALKAMLSLGLLTAIWVSELQGMDLPVKEESVLRDSLQDTKNKLLFWQDPGKFIQQADLSLYDSKTKAYFLNYLARYCPNNHEAFNKLWLQVEDPQSVMAEVEKALLWSMERGLPRYALSLERLLGLMEYYDSKDFHVLPGYHWLLEACCESPNLDLTRQDLTGNPLIFRVFKNTAFFPYQDTVLRKIFDLAIEHHDRYVAGQSSTSPFLIKNKENHNIVEHYQQEHLKGQQAHWFLGYILAKQRKHQISLAEDPEYVKVFGSFVLEYDSDPLWLKKWVSILRDYHRGDIPKNIIHDYLATLSCEDILKDKAFRYSYSRIGLGRSKDFFNFVSANSLEREKQRCVVVQRSRDYRDYAKNLQKLLKANHRNKEDIFTLLRTFMNEYSAHLSQEEAVEWEKRTPSKGEMMALLLDDDNLSFIDEAQGILYPSHDLAQQSYNEYDFFSLAFKHQAFGIAKYLFENHFSRKIPLDGTIIYKLEKMDAKMLEESFYFKLVKSFPEFITYNDGILDVFSLIFDAHPRRFNPDILNDLVTRYPHKLGETNPDTLRPYLFNVIELVLGGSTRFHIEDWLTFHCLIPLLYEHPYLTTITSDHNLDLKTWVQNQTPFMVDRRELNENNKRKEALLEAIDLVTFFIF